MSKANVALYRYHKEGSYTTSCLGNYWYVDPYYLRDIYLTTADARTGQQNPDYSTDIAFARDATTAYSRTSYEILSDVSNTGDMLQLLPCGTQKTSAESVKEFPGGAVAFNPLALSDLDARDRALKTLKSKLQSARARSKLLVPAAELRELRLTVKGAAGVAGNLVKAAIGLRRGKFRDVKSAFDDIWLTYSFGVAPLVSDAKAIAESIAAWNFKQQGSTLRLTGTRTHDVGGQDLFVSGSNTFTQLSSLTHRLSYKGTIGYKFIAGFANQFETANTYGAKDHFGLGLADLPSTLYELTAFSWVLDYFTTMGDYLADVFQTPDVSTIYVVENKQVDVVYNYVSKPSPFREPAIGEYNRIRSGQLRVRARGFSRTSLPQLPVRSLRIKTADEISTNAVNRLLNLIAVSGFGRNPYR